MILFFFDLETVNSLLLFENFLEISDSCEVGSCFKRRRVQSQSVSSRCQRGRGRVFYYYGYYVSVFEDCIKFAHVRNVKIAIFFYLIWNWLRIFAPDSHKKGEIIVLLPWNTFRNTVEREESKIKVNAVNLIFNLWFSQFKVISEEFIKKISLFTLGTHLKLD